MPVLVSSCDILGQSSLTIPKVSEFLYQSAGAAPVEEPQIEPPRPTPEKEPSRVPVAPPPLERPSPDAVPTRVPQVDPCRRFSTCTL